MLPELSNVQLPKFKDLTCLKFDITSDPEYILLPKLLQNSPRLQFLYLVHEKKLDLNRNLHALLLHEVPSCFFFQLKEIDIDPFLEVDMQIVDYILKNAKVLEKLTLHYDIRRTDPVEVQDKFLKALELLPRVSTICKVVIISSVIGVVNCYGYKLLARVNV